MKERSVSVASMWPCRRKNIFGLPGLPPDQRVDRHARHHQGQAHDDELALPFICSSTWASEALDRIPPHFAPILPATGSKAKDSEA